MNATIQLLQDIDPALSGTAMGNARIVRYDTQAFPFRKCIEKKIFRIDQLDQLHATVLRSRNGGQAGVQMKDNLYYRQLLEKMPDDSAFYRIYHAFARFCLAPLFGGKMSYSGHPSFRVHMPGTRRISGWHRDADITRRLDQINVWLPFTDTWGSNTLWTERHYGIGDFFPVSVNYGQALLFDGGMLQHGSVSNDTDVTRVSMDFRFAPLRKEMADQALSILSMRPVPGGASAT